MRKLIFRKGHPKDKSSLKQLTIETISTVCLRNYDPQQIRAWISNIETKRDWDKLLKEQYVLTAQQEEKIVGFISLKNGYFIDLFYAHKDHQREEIGAQLYKKTEEKARQEKQSKLIADVSKTAKPFFEQMNFRLIQPQDILIGNVSFVNYKMGRRIY